MDLLTHRVDAAQAEALGIPEGSTVLLKATEQVDFFKAVDKPISISFPIERFDELRRIMTNTHRRCVFVLDTVGELQEDGTRIVTVRLEPI